MLGVDPGLTRCGLGAVTSTGGRVVRIVDVGVATSSPDTPLELRLLRISSEIEDWMDRLEPDAVAVERVFAQSNVSTVTGTAQVAGLAMVAAARRGIPVELHTPSEVKAAITGNGRAEKEQVTTMVTRILGLDSPPRPADAADALALAICHAWRSPVGRRPASAPAPAAGPSASTSSTTGVTAAQALWLEAERRSRRQGRRVAPARGPVGR
ncbi:crossover junction endodeoxyribonuclease RuvC [Serinibacter arcticus]|uniref:Crossover junction endodeoxyribonuclease RuvC n=1 Tax=Serinibacter arcticus TaxID=1655435 RepID=A0A2U1ZZA3_9MICO|nr:crossover junction endodeoxyribonuclease RuvC [Serinibacter arcticus]PWD52309.1 crossover junction endodeoxyribonuclease RuvC [Serinibacter arcticus]